MINDHLSIVVEHLIFLFENIKKTNKFLQKYHLRVAKRTVYALCLVHRPNE